MSTTEPFDPYRQEPTHPVDQLRRTIRQALEGLSKACDYFPPSRLETLAVELAKIAEKGDPPKTELEVLKALTDLRPLDVVGGTDIVMSDDFVALSSADRYEEEVDFHPLRPFWASALRILRIGDEGSADAAIELRLNDYPIVSRCDIREFEQMTPIVGCVISRQCQPRIFFWTGNKSLSFRVVLRGEYARDPYPAGYPYAGPWTGYPSGPGFGVSNAELHVGRVPYYPQLPRRGF